MRSPSPASYRWHIAHRYSPSPPLHVYHPYKKPEQSQSQDLEQRSEPQQQAPPQPQYQPQPPNYDLEPSRMATVPLVQPIDFARFPLQYHSQVHAESHTRDNNRQKPRQSASTSSTSTSSTGNSNTASSTSPSAETNSNTSTVTVPSADESSLTPTSAPPHQQTFSPRNYSPPNQVQVLTPSDTGSVPLLSPREAGVNSPWSQSKAIPAAATATASRDVSFHPAAIPYAQVAPYTTADLQNEGYPAPAYQYYQQPYAMSPPQPQESTDDKRRQREQLKSRRHVCPVCDKRFNRPSSLNTHMSVHTGAKPYQCTKEGCGRRFSVSSNLRRHERKTHEQRARPKQPAPPPATSAHSRSAPPMPYPQGGFYANAAAPVASNPYAYPAYAPGQGAAPTPFHYGMS